MGSLKLPSRDPFLKICSDIDFAVNENLSQVEFTCPKLANQLESRSEDTDSESDSDWEAEDIPNDGNPFDVLKIKRHPQLFCYF